MSLPLSLAALLAAAPMVRVIGTDEKREQKQDDVIVEIEWVTPLPGFRLAFSLREQQSWHVVDLGGKRGPFARFAVKSGREGLRYMVFEQAGHRPRWQILEGGSYDCSRGGRVAGKVRTELAADGRLRLQASYQSQGCAGSTSQSHEGQGRLRSDDPPPPTCCVDEREPVRSTFVRRCGGEGGSWEGSMELHLGAPPPSIVDDVLTVVVAHGGCGSDELSLCYQPLSAASKVRVPFYTHYKHDGPRCDSRHVQRHAFELGNLKRDYLRTFGRPAQPVTLVIPGVGDVPYLP
jgi:hypothetical protein